LDGIKFEDLFNKSELDGLKEKKPQQKTKKSSKSSQQQQKVEHQLNSSEQLNEKLSSSSSLEIERIEKKNWIQNYVDSDGTATNLIQTVSSVLSPSAVETSEERESDQQTPTSTFYVESSRSDMATDESRSGFDTTNSTIITSTTNLDVNVRNIEEANAVSLTDSEYVILKSVLKVDF